MNKTRAGIYAAWVAGTLVWAATLGALLFSFSKLRVSTEHSKVEVEMPVQILEDAVALPEVAPVEVASPSAAIASKRQSVPRPSVTSAERDAKHIEVRHQPAHESPAAPDRLPQPPAISRAAPSENAVANSEDTANPQPADAAGTSSETTSNVPAESSKGNSGAAGDTTARATYQPLPEVPDELREQAFRSVAVARFVVHADGHCDVSLVTPMRDPTLNRLLLASLREWRFTPALEHGRATETTVDLRVHFNVQ